ncbi:PAS domain-containing protein [Mariprofundus sp. KV]|uniref:PAS domain-containing protein n=1 Tax=Mariprofundus sp. KV TaxID=2608715 RepID=UPI0015A457AA|nr:PAS domain-containing protein [Mariprofundus sp. KV]NWF35403.1 PAS domain-containing protein [Mariprofundus sp. KV]
MSELEQAPERDEELSRLQQRMKKLAMEKSYYQLVMQMITRISENRGLGNVVNNLLMNTVDILGGSNLKLYYQMGGKYYYADVLGEERELAQIDDEAVMRAYQSGQTEEIEGSFEETLLNTPEFTHSYTWIFPLKAASEVIGVLKMENLHINMRELHEHLPAFFNFAALILKNEILSESALRKANLTLEGEVLTRKEKERELVEAKSGLEAAVAERTAELSKNKEELDLFFTSALDLLCIADTDGHFRKLNPEWENTLGYPLDELVGRKFLDLIHPDDLEGTLKAISRLSDQNPVLSFSNRYRHKDGSYRWLEWRSYPVGSSIYASARDITERKNIERVEQARLHLFQFAQDHSMDELLEETLNEVERLTGSCIGFFHFVEEDQETLWLQNWSTRTKAEFCKAEGKGAHYPVADAGVWADALRNMEPLIHNDYASLPDKHGMPEGHAEVNRELVVPVQRGEQIVAILGTGNKQSDYNDEDVKTVTFLADLAWDIAEKKRAEEALAINERNLSDAQRMGHLGNWRLDLLSNKLEWSDEIYRIFEIDPQQFEATYEAFLNAIHPDDREMVNKAYNQSLQNRKPYETVHRLLMPDGRVKYVQEQCETNFDKEGIALYSVGTVHDITELKEAEAEIKRFNAELEQKVAERTGKLNETNKRLESFNELMAEREMRVIEVKQEVNRLSRKLGEPLPYKEVWDALQEK